MKFFLLILGVVFGVLGVGFTGYGWYVAGAQGRIFDGLTYSGPFLLIVGAWRVFSSMLPTPPPAVLRIIAVGIGIAAGYGNTTLLKTVFPGDQIISTNSAHQ
jgi:hypothetical protein